MFNICIRSFRLRFIYYYYQILVLTLRDFKKARSLVVSTMSSDIKASWFESAASYVQKWAFCRDMLSAKVIRLMSKRLWKPLALVVWNYRYSLSLLLLSCESWMFVKEYPDRTNTAQKMKFSIEDFFRKYDQIRRKLQIWSHLLKKSLMENFAYFAVKILNNLSRF